MKLKTVIRSGLAMAMLCFSLAAPAQVSINTNLTTGTMTSGVANLYRSAYLHFQLVNCGDNIPVVPGQPNAVVQDSFDLRPATPGSAIVGQILGNDQITCGNVISTYYEITAMKDASHPLRDGIPYVICSALATISTCGNGASLGSFNIVTADPMSQPPPVPGFVEVYGNPSNNQAINQPTGTIFNFYGTWEFNQGVLLTPVPVTQLATLVGLANFVLTSDGTPGTSPCQAGGGGAPAFYYAGAWSCSSGTGGGGGGGGSTFTGTAGRIPIFISGTNGGNSCLYDSGMGGLNPGSILNACPNESFNLNSFQSVIWPSLVTIPAINTTTLNATTLNATTINWTGPMILDSPAAATTPAAPLTGHGRLAMLSTGLFGEYPVGGTAYYPFSTQYANFPLGGNITAQGATSLFGDVSYIDASSPAFTGSDNCVSILAAENANTTYSPVIDARGFQGLFTCASASIMSLISPSWQGGLEVGTAQIRPSNGIGIPRKTMVQGAGWQTGSGQPYVGSTVFQATNIPTNTPLMGWTDDNVGFNFNSGPVFDSPVSQITLDCVSVAGCIGFADYVGQEGSALTNVNILGFGNGGIGLQIGGGSVVVTPGAPTQTYGQAVPCNASSCPITLPLPQIAGETIQICARWLPTSVTLTGGTNVTTHDTYSPITGTAGTDGGANAFGCIYSNNINAGTGTIGLSFSGTVNTNTLYVAAAEYANITSPKGTFDGTPAYALSTTHGPGPSVTTTVNGDLIVAMAITATNSSSWAAGSGFTSRIATGLIGIEDQVQATAGAIAPTWTSTNTAHTGMFTVAWLAGTNNGAGAQNGWIDGIDFSLGQGTTITRTAKCYDINTSLPGNAGPKHFNDMTCTAQGSASAPPNEEATVGGSHMTFMNHHFENYGVAALMIGEAEGANSDEWVNVNSGNADVALSFTISTATESGNVGTFTTSAPCAGLNAGQPITTAGVGVSGYNQTSTQAVPFVVATSCLGSTFTANLAASGLSSSSAGTVTVQNALVAISGNNPNSTGGDCLFNTSAAGPKLPSLLLNDELNGNYIPTSDENYLAIYCLGAPGSLLPGTGAGENLLTTSGQVPSHLWKLSTQLDTTDYQGISTHGDGQAGGATQPPAKDGFFTVPPTWQQIVVSSNAVQGAGSVILLDDDPGSLALYGGSPAACNLAQFLGWKIIAKQGPLTPYPNFTAYPIENVTSSSVTSNVTTLTVASPIGSSYPAGTIIRHAGDSNSNLNALGLVTSNSATTIVYTQIISNTTGTGGTVQTVPGFAVAFSAAVSTTPECYSYHIRD